MVNRSSLIFGTSFLLPSRGTCICEKFLERFKASTSQQLVSEPCHFSEESSMANKMTGSGELATPVPSQKLSRTNYRVCSMAMEVYLDSHDL